ncbi:MAG TPA: VCBS repeat-containing protein [Terriglobia bacterium]|nr:VCBS repeat-containing protein [Terriglobia bacterium]
MAKNAIAILTFAAALIGASWTAFATPPAQQASPSLDFTRQVISVGKGPGIVAIADVNRDGIPDLLVANEEEGTISVLLGNGRGHFTAAHASPSPCNPKPNDIAVADMNGDGNPDLMIANHQTPYLTILLGDGKGGFEPAPHSPFATESRPHPHGVAVGDFMGNGKPAVVTDSWGNGKILLIPGDGRGGLILPGKFFPSDTHTDQGVRSADFNKDGHPDIVSNGEKSNGVSLMLGDGHGGFRRAPGSPFAAGAAPWAFTIDDVNRDGNPDVLAIPYHRDLSDLKLLGVTVLLGDGKGGFRIMRGSPLPLAGCAGPDRIAAGDLTGRGRRDIVVSCALNNKLLFFLAQKAESFTASSHNVPTGWGGLAVGRIDRHGRDAIIVSNHDSGTITVLLAR